MALLHVRPTSQFCSEEHRESDKDGEREKERGGELTLKQHNKETTLQSHRRLHFMFLNNSRS